MGNNFMFGRWGTAQRTLASIWRGRLSRKRGTEEAGKYADIARVWRPHFGDGRAPPQLTSARRTGIRSIRMKSPPYIPAITITSDSFTQLVSLVLIDLLGIGFYLNRCPKSGALLSIMGSAGL
jgi:hypothetical protein